MNHDVMFSSKTDMWETPQWLFDELDERYHFTLDACATEENAKCANFYSTWNGKTLSTFLSLDHTGAPIYGHSPVYVCSCCGRYSLLQTNYCPHCGAKMDGGENHGN